MNRERQIELFDDFRRSMLSYFSVYDSRREEKRKKSTTSHRIALALSKEMEGTEADLDLDGVDILVHIKEKPVLALFWSSTYLTEKEKEKARLYHISSSPALTLAFSLLEDKDYLLVYRFEKDYLEYLHINKEDFSEYLLKRCLIESGNTEPDDQLLFDIAKKRRKKRVRSQEAFQQTEAQQSDHSSDVIQ